MESHVADSLVYKVLGPNQAYITSINRYENAQVSDHKHMYMHQNKDPSVRRLGLYIQIQYRRYRLHQMNIQCKGSG